MHLNTEEIEFLSIKDIPALQLGKNKEIEAMHELPVLVVEDNKINQKIAFIVMKKYGFGKIEIAENGLEAVERYQDGHFK